MIRRVRKFKPAAKVRCDIWESYGCPSPGGDEFVAPVDVQCRSAATHTVKYEDGLFGRYSMKVCAHHARYYAADGDKVYRFRTV